MIVPGWEYIVVKPVNLISKWKDFNEEWQAHQRSGNVKIWMAITNNIKTGGKDKYYIMKCFPRNEKVFVNLQTMPSSFYKVFLEGDYNSVNRWMITDLKKNN